MVAPPSPIKSSTKLAARFPVKPSMTDSVSLANKFFFSNRYLFSFFFFYSSCFSRWKSCWVHERVLVPGWMKPIEKYDPSVYLISASRREFFSLARDHFKCRDVSMCIFSFSFFFTLLFFIFQRDCRGIKIRVASRSCVWSATCSRGSLSNKRYHFVPLRREIDSHFQKPRKRNVPVASNTSQSIPVLFSSSVTT